MKKIKTIIFIILIALIPVATWVTQSNTEMDGHFLSVYIDEHGLTDIIVEKQYDGSFVSETTLNNHQIAELKLLFDGTSFTRIFNSTISYTDQNTYYIVGKTASGNQYLHLEVQGQEFVVAHLSDEVDGLLNYKLLIENESWKATIEDIIAA